MKEVSSLKVLCQESHKLLPRLMCFVQYVTGQGEGQFVENVGLKKLFNSNYISNMRNESQSNHGLLQFMIFTKMGQGRGNKIIYLYWKGIDTRKAHAKCASLRSTVLKVIGNVQCLCHRQTNI